VAKASLLVSFIKVCLPAAQVAADVGDELLVSPDDAATMFYEAEARRRAAVTPLAVSHAWVCVWGASGSVCCLSVCLSAEGHAALPVIRVLACRACAWGKQRMQHRMCQTRLRVGVISLEGQSDPWTAREFSSGHVHVAVCMHARLGPLRHALRMCAVCSNACSRSGSACTPPLRSIQAL